MRLAAPAPILALILALPTSALAQKATAPVGPVTAPLHHLVFGEVVSLPPAFASAGGARPDNVQRSDTGFLAEYIPRDETPRDWSRMTTFTGNRGLARGVPDAQAGQVARATLDRLQTLFRTPCIGALDYQSLAAPAVPGTRATAAAWVSCSHVQTSGQAEDVVALILVTGENVFSVQLATRGPAQPLGLPRNPTDWDQRLAHLAQARVCIPPPGVAAPSPSCN